MVYDVTDMATFDNVSRWWKTARSHNDSVPILIFGTKTDLASQRVITPELVLERCGNLGVIFGEGSAKSGVGVGEAFASLMPSLIAHRHQRRGKGISATGGGLDLAAPAPAKKKCLLL